MCLHGREAAGAINFYTETLKGQISQIEFGFHKTKKLLGTTVSGKASYVHGLYFQGSYQLLTAKIYKRYSHGSGRGTGGEIIVK